MPNYLEFKRKTTGETVGISRVDEELCAHAGVPVDPKKYYLEWYSGLGLVLALGKDYSYCWTMFEDSPDLLEVIDFMEKNYTTDAWYQPH